MLWVWHPQLFRDVDFYPVNIVIRYFKTNSIFLTISLINRYEIVCNWLFQKLLIVDENRIAGSLLNVPYAHDHEEGHADEDEDEGDVHANRLIHHFLEEHETYCQHTDHHHKLWKLVEKGILNKSVLFSVYSVHTKSLLFNINKDLIILGPVHGLLEVVFVQALPSQMTVALAGRVGLYDHSVGSADGHDHFFFHAAEVKSLINLEIRHILIISHFCFILVNAMLQILLTHIGFIVFVHRYLVYGR